MAAVRDKRATERAARAAAGHHAPPPSAAPALTPVGPRPRRPRRRRRRRPERPASSPPRRPSASSRSPRTAEPAPGSGPATGSASVDMLGVAQEVVAPIDGVVGASLAESGDAVEYGQELVVIEFAVRARTVGRGLTRVPQDPHRQPRRDRPARSCAPAASSASRPSSPTARRTATRSPSSSPTRPSASARPTPSGRTCSAPAVISAALVTGCDAIHPGLRLPVRGRGLRRGRRRPRPDVHRAARDRPRAVRQQGRHAPAARRPRPADDPGLGRDAARRDARPRRGGADRLPGPHQAVGRRRRQGHAHGPHRRASSSRSLKVCRSEAKAAFGDDSLYLEKWLDENRHVEVQVAVDRYGHGVHLGERDCSVQRRHQKILEEAPTPALVADARAGARRAGHPGRRRGRLRERRARSSSSSTAAATAYFIEINCRIQVEHPVTEMLTGIDLVATQIRIAAGEPLGFSQADVTLRRPRHRVPDQRRGPGGTTSGPAPASSSATTPRAGPGVRLDSHLYTRLRGPAVLRLAARQAHRLGPGPRDGHRPRPGRARRARRRGPRHQRRHPPGAARQRDVPGRPDDHQPARPRRQRRLPGRCRPLVRPVVQTCTDRAARRPVARPH